MVNSTYYILDPLLMKLRYAAIWILIKEHTTHIIAIELSIATY